MSSTRWNLSRAPLQGPASRHVVLLTEPIQRAPRCMAAFGGLLGAIGIWDLLIKPVFFSKLPWLGLLGLPFWILALMCGTLMVLGFGYALLASRHEITIDSEQATLNSTLRLSLPWKLTWTVRLQDIIRVWVEQSDFHETRETWCLNISLRDARAPKVLHTLGRKADAEELAKAARGAIERVTGRSLLD